MIRRRRLLKGTSEFLVSSSNWLFASSISGLSSDVRRIAGRAIPQEDSATANHLSLEVHRSRYPAVMFENDDLNIGKIRDGKLSTYDILNRNDRPERISFFISENQT